MAVRQIKLQNGYVYFNINSIIQHITDKTYWTINNEFIQTINVQENFPIQKI